MQTNSYEKNCRETTFFVKVIGSKRQVKGSLGHVVKFTFAVKRH